MVLIVSLGVLPLEMLPHCSYTYLYTFLTNLIEVTLCFLRSDEVSLSVTLDDVSGLFVCK